jgi:hypothetical protein
MSSETNAGKTSDDLEIRSEPCGSSVQGKESTPLTIFEASWWSDARLRQVFPRKMCCGMLSELRVAYTSFHSHTHDRFSRSDPDLSNDNVI